MDKRYKEYFKRVAQNENIPEYAVEYFDHLYNEYLALPPEKIPRDVSNRMGEIYRKRQDKKLRWSDVYGFDLMLVDWLPLGDLIRKAYDMRAKYRSVAGQRDYDAYIASRPPDLSLLPVSGEAESHRLPLQDAGESQGDDSPPISSPPAQDDDSLILSSPPSNDDESTPISSPPAITSPPGLPTPQASPLTVESVRADIRYLLGQFYLYYALLPYREGFRDELTRRARQLTFIFLGVFALMLISTGIEYRWRVVLVPTVLVVVVTGIVGGCVSMLQRIQSTPADGDAIFNLASLSNGWTGMSLSPLYGAIFAVLFYMLFAGGIVKGVVFPDIATPDGWSQQSPQQQAVATQSATGADAQTDETTAPSPNPTAPSPSPTAPPSPNPATPASSKQNTRAPSLFWSFTDGTYPKTGTAYSLLIIWSFLAGFLERLVPDALNRLVMKNQIIEGTPT